MMGLKRIGANLYVTVVIDSHRAPLSEVMVTVITTF